MKERRIIINLGINKSLNVKKNILNCLYFIKVVKNKKNTLKIDSYHTFRSQTLQCFINDKLQYGFDL